MNSQPTVINSKEPPGINALSIYTACVSGMGLGVLFWALSRIALFWPEILPFLAFVILAELTVSTDFAPQIIFSMSSIVNFATLLFLGPVPATLTAMVGGGVVTFTTEFIEKQRKRARAPVWQRALFNISVFGLSTFVAGISYLCFGGKVGTVKQFSNSCLLYTSDAADE